MMAAVLGKIEEFDHRKEDWDLYIERLEHFFVANAITEPERKRAVFLLVIGASTYKTLRSLLSPNKPGEQDYRELVQKLSEHYSPRPSEIVEGLSFTRASESQVNQLPVLLLSFVHCLNIVTSETT